MLTTLSWFVTLSVGLVTLLPFYPFLCLVKCVYVVLLSGCMLILQSVLYLLSSFPLPQTNNPLGLSLW